MSALGAYLSAFVPKSWALVSGPALYGVDRVAERYWPWAKDQLDRIPTHVRRFIEISLLLVAICYAGFSVWNDERNNFNAEHALRTKAEERATAAEAGYARQAAFSNALKDFYTECDNLINERISITTLDEYNLYVPKVNNFSERLYKWILANMGVAGKAKLTQFSLAPNLKLNKAVNEDHSNTVIALMNMKANLDSLIQNPIWDKR
jgi:hypothetical protein